VAFHHADALVLLVQRRGGAMTVGKPDYGSTLKQLPSDKPGAIVKGASGRPLACSVTQSQANGLAGRWRAGWTTMAFDSWSWRTLWVDGPSDHELRLPRRLSSRLQARAREEHLLPAVQRQSELT
jgi:hypothetical protein